MFDWKDDGGVVDAANYLVSIFTFFLCVCVFLRCQRAYLKSMDLDGVLQSQRFFSLLSGLPCSWANHLACLTDEPYREVCWEVLQGKLCFLVDSWPLQLFSVFLKENIDAALSWSHWETPGELQKYCQAFYSYWINTTTTYLEPRCYLKKIKQQHLSHC